MATSSSSQPTGTPEEMAAQLYGYMAAYLSDPEIGPILKQAASEGWSEDRLQGALSSTAWWTATNNAAKQWQALQIQNPTEAESQIGARIEDLRQRAQQQGFGLSDAGLRDVAQNSLQYGWSAAQMDKAIGEEATKRPGDLERLRTSTLAGRLDKTISDYGIPMSAQSKDKWLADIASGRSSEDDFLNEAKGIATSLYPTMAQAIKDGSTVNQAFDPYRQLASQTLNIAPDQVDLSDPKWSSALSVENDKGQKTAMSLDQWQQQIKSNPSYGYQFTDDARNQAYAMAAQLGQTFGRS